MNLRYNPWLGRMVALGACVALGLAISSYDAAPLVLIPVLLATIFAISLAQGGRLDIVLYIVMAAAFMLPMNNARISSSLTIGDGFIVLALVAILIERALEHSLALPGMDGLLAGIVMIIGGGLLGSFFAVSLGASVAGLARFGAATITLPVVFGLWRPDMPKLRMVGWAIVLGSSTNALIGILAIRTVGRALGLSTQPNHLALASLMAVGVGLGLRYSTGKSGRLLLLALLPVLMTATLLSGSRSGLIAEIVVVVFITILTRDHKLISLTVATSALFGIAVMFRLVGKSGSSAIGRLFGGGGAAASDQQRSLTLKAALFTIVRHPVTGSGFQLALSTHEIILEVAATAGVFGVVGLGLVGWIVLRPTWVHYRWGMARRIYSDDGLLIGSMAAVVGFYANGLFGNQLYDRYIWMVFTLAAAAAYELRSRTTRNSSGLKMTTDAT